LTELQTTLKQIHEFAAIHASQEQQKYVGHYNKRAANNHFEVGSFEAVPFSPAFLLICRRMCSVM